MAKYGAAEYWDDRYEKEPECFDWYQTYATLKSRLQMVVKRSDVILMVGCGSSRLSEEMYADEYTSIANIDISKVVIEQQKERNKERQTLRWDVADTTKKLEFPDQTFHVVIDKGTLDCILCGESSTNNVTNALYEIVRVLKPDGKFVLISHGIPDKWIGYLDQTQYGWRVSCYALPRPSLAQLQSGTGAGGTLALPPAFTGGPIVISGVDGPYYPPNIHFMYVCEKKPSSDLGVLRE